MNKIQFTSLLDRLVVVAVSYAVGAGYVAPGDEQTWVAILIAVISGGFALWNNRQQRLAEKAASQGMTVIAPQNVADKTLSQSIVSATDFMLARK